MRWIDKLQEREFILTIVKVLFTFALLFGLAVDESDIVKVVDGVATAIVLGAYIVARTKAKSDSEKAEAIIIASENAIDAALAGGAQTQP